MALEDAALAKCLGSRPGRPHPEPVGTFESAASVFGMRDAAGGVWQWTSSWFDNAREAKVVRGGSWGSPTSELRCTFRRSYPTDHRSQYIGFRCVHTLDLT